MESRKRGLIAFASKSLTKSQGRYCITRRELLAVVTFIQQFRHYLLGREFLVRTDHSALRWVMSFKESIDQMARWLEILSQYDFKIEHRAGKQHMNADALSRIPCDPCECQCYNGQKVLSELPCAGCTTCVKRHEAWSTLIEDTVPPSARNIRIPGESRAWGSWMLAGGTGVSCRHGRECLAGDGKHSCEQLSGLGPAGRVPLERKCYTHQVLTANVAVDGYSVATLWWGIHQT